LIPTNWVIALPHLTLRQGYALDFVYQYDGMGGRPILYAREESAAPYESYEDYQNALGGTEIPYDAYLEFIESDGTEEGYFQWALLQMMGNQFYLYWHAGYNDAEIIASSERLGEVVDEMVGTQFGEPLSASQKRQALRIDPAPVVTIEGEEVTVRVVWFTKWGGFYETMHTLTATEPFQIIDSQTHELVPYECQVMF